MAKAKTLGDPLSPGHHMGKSTGYDVRADGRIVLAPMHAGRLREIMSREDGLRNLLACTNEFVAQELTRTSKERHDWWQRISDDIGIDPNDDWRFNRHDGAIVKSPALDGEVAGE